MGIRENLSLARLEKRSVFRRFREDKRFIICEYLILLYFVSVFCYDVESMFPRAIFSATWFDFLEVEARELATLSVELLERETRLSSAYQDYGFVVFPMSKAYESFLKKYFYTLGLIDQEQYNHRQFRIGKALNPDVSYRQRDEYWLFDDISASCSQDLARYLWETWLKCRNHIFHYFPDFRASISLEQARELLVMMHSAMTQALECHAKKKVNL